MQFHESILSLHAIFFSLIDQQDKYIKDELYIRRLNNKRGRLHSVDMSAETMEEVLAHHLTQAHTVVQNNEMHIDSDREIMIKAEVDPALNEGNYV